MSLEHAQRDAVELDFSKEDLRMMLNEEIRKGILTVTHGPMQASLDKIEVAKPISRSNIQIVPLWYNHAKHKWPENEVREAIKRFAATL